MALFSPFSLFGRQKQHSSWLTDLVTYLPDGWLANQDAHAGHNNGDRWMPDGGQQQQQQQQQQEKQKQHK